MPRVVSPATASGCVYCAFRQQIANLQAQRLRLTAVRSFHSSTPALNPRRASSTREHSFKRVRQTDEERLPRRVSSSRETRSARARGADENRAPLEPQPRRVNQDELRRNGYFPSVKVFRPNQQGKGLSVTSASKREPRRTLEKFEEVLKEQLLSLKQNLAFAPVLQSISEETGRTKEQVFETAWRDLMVELQGTGPGATPFSGKSAASRSLYKRCTELYLRHGGSGLFTRLRYTFFDVLLGGRHQDPHSMRQRALTDLSHPPEWYPEARKLTRTFHLHVGPTNSGKTYQALQRLEQAQSGIFAGPLRLLAYEVYTRLNAKGIVTNLITGDDVRGPPEAIGDISGCRVSACTVEMIPMRQEADVCVIDEIQMIADPERGAAWTSAVLGCRAHEIHLCGEARAVPLIQQLCASTGEKLHIHRYERLSPLKMDDESLKGNLSNLRKGDCVVSFSVMGIHALRKQIELRTKRKVAIVYGALPPETRATQAKLFNDPDNDYDYLVASDAIGMGLNLAIKRVVFEGVIRYDAKSGWIQLPTASIKQIAGRAGRYRTAAQAAQSSESQQAVSNAKGDDAPVTKGPDTIGLVTTLHAEDFPIVATALDTEPDPLKTAGIEPPIQIMQQLASYYPALTPFSYIYTKVQEICKLSRRFHLCDRPQKLAIATAIDDVRGLMITDRDSFINVPGGNKQDGVAMFDKLLPAFAEKIAKKEEANIVDMTHLPLEVLDEPPDSTRDYLTKLEMLHKGVIAYLWLAYRFSDIFTTRALAMHLKEEVEAKIAATLDSMTYVDRARQLKILRMQHEKYRHQNQEQEVLLREDGPDEQEMDRVLDLGSEASVDELGSDRKESYAVREAQEGTSDQAVGQAAQENVFLTDLAESFDMGEQGEEASEEPMLETLADEQDSATQDAQAAVDEVAGEGTTKSTTTNIAVGANAFTSFAAWRAKQTRGESQGSHEEDDVVANRTAASDEEKGVTQAPLPDVDNAEDATRTSFAHDRTQLEHLTSDNYPSSSTKARPFIDANERPQASASAS